MLCYITCTNPKMFWFGLIVHYLWPGLVTRLYFVYLLSVFEFILYGVIVL